eukprot:g1820.t1
MGAIIDKCSPQVREPEHRIYKVVEEKPGQGHEAMHNFHILGMHEAQRNTLFSFFCETDWDKTGQSQAEELYNFCDLKMTPVFTKMFALFQLRQSGAFDFHEFVFAAFHALSMDINAGILLKSIFKMYCPQNRGGVLDADEMRKQHVQEAVKDCYGPGETGSLRKALDELADQSLNSESKVKVDDFVKLINDGCPLVRARLEKTQTGLRERIIGLAFWLKAADHRPTTIAKLRKSQRILYRPKDGDHTLSDDLKTQRSFDPAERLLAYDFCPRVILSAQDQAGQHHHGGGGAAADGRRGSADGAAGLTKKRLPKVAASGAVRGGDQPVLMDPDAPDYEMEAAKQVAEAKRATWIARKTSNQLDSEKKQREDQNMSVSARLKASGLVGTGNNLPPELPLRTRILDDWNEETSDGSDDGGGGSGDDGEGEGGGGGGGGGGKKHHGHHGHHHHHVRQGRAQKEGMLGVSQ